MSTDCAVDKGTSETCATVAQSKPYWYQSAMQLHLPYFKSNNGRYSVKVLISHLHISKYIISCYTVALYLSHLDVGSPNNGPVEYSQGEWGRLT